MVVLPDDFSVERDAQTFGLRRNVSLALITNVSRAFQAHSFTTIAEFMERTNRCLIGRNQIAGLQPHPAEQPFGCPLAYRCTQFVDRFGSPSFDFEKGQAAWQLVVE